MSKVWKLDPDTVAEAFVEALVIERRYCCLLWGPFGSSKSVTACHAVYLLSLMQPRVAGKRRSKWAFVRNTNDQLKQTTLATWLEWFPENEFRRYLVGEKRYEWREGDLEIDILFLPLDSPEDVRKLLSLELTGCFLNESREIEKTIWDGVDGRVGRFPPAADIAPGLAWSPARPASAGRYYRRVGGDAAVPEEVYVRGGRRGQPLEANRELDEGDGIEWAVAPWSGIIADSNPSSTDDFLWKQFFEAAVEKPEVGWKYSGFRQPPGLLRSGPGRWETNPAAENLRNLKPGYYKNLAAGKGEQWVRMYCCGEAVVLSDGKPVFPQFDPAWHVADFAFDPRLPVYAAFDFGVNGQACLLGQVSARGQLRIFDEFVGEDIGMYQFATSVVKPGLARYRGARYELAWGDPAGGKRADTDEKSSMELLNGAYPEMQVGLPFSTYPAHTNSLQPRLDAVNWFLSGTVPRRSQDEPTAPRCVVHPRCKVLIAALAGRYEYRRVQTSEQRYTEVPNKNRWSHPADAAQYLCMGLLSHMEWGQKEEDDERPKRGYAQAHRTLSGY
jgi:hypothetical protein